MRCVKSFVMVFLVLNVVTKTYPMLRDCTNTISSSGKYSELGQSCIKTQFHKKMIDEYHFDPRARNVIHEALEQLNCPPQFFDKKLENLCNHLKANKLAIVLSEKVGVSFIAYAVKVCGRSPECYRIIEQLLLAGCRLGTDDFVAREVLHCAMECRNTALVGFLLNNGVSCDIPLNHQNMTALHLACFQGSVEMCQLLLKAGACVNKIDNTLATPLHYACGKPILFSDDRIMFGLFPNQTIGLFQQNKSKQYHCHIKIIENLLDAGAQDAAKDGSNSTPYTYAVDYGHIVLQKKIDYLTNGIDSSESEDHDENSYFNEHNDFDEHN